MSLVARLQRISHNFLPCAGVNEAAGRPTTSECLPPQAGEGGGRARLPARVGSVRSRRGSESKLPACTTKLRSLGGMQRTAVAGPKNPVAYFFQIGLPSAAEDAFSEAALGDH